MVWFNKDTGMIISWIETFASKVWYTSIFNSKNLPYLKVENTCKISPERNLNLKPAFISKLNVSPRLWWASFQSYISNLSYLDYHTDNVNSLLLDHFLNLFESNKRETLLLDLIILLSLCNISILVKGQTVVILDRSELFVGKLYLSISEQKHLVLSNHWSIFSSCFLTEKGRLNLGTIFVDHLDVHQSSFSTAILPPFRLILTSNTCPNFPVSRKLIENTNWSINILNWWHSCSRLIEITGITVPSWVNCGLRDYSWELFFFFHWRMDNMMTWSRGSTTSSTYINLVAEVIIEWIWNRLNVNFILVVTIVIFICLNSPNLDRFLLVSFVSWNPQIHLSFKPIIVFVVWIVSGIPNDFMHTSINDLRWLFHHKHTD